MYSNEVALQGSDLIQCEVENAFNTVSNNECCMYKKWFCYFREIDLRVEA